LGVALVGDRAMRPLNRRFRGLDETTDVLAFPRGHPPAGEDGYIGDVAISVDEALRLAEEEKTPVEEAVDRLLIHGVLHLKGFDHYTPRKAARMRQRERRLRAVLRRLRSPKGAARRHPARSRGRSGRRPREA